ncbi:MAG TPA: hypothetical protein PLG79_04640 [Spirochaetales bacterium]|nr:hypothetical protein [Spirochaetales bacterium]
MEKNGEWRKGGFLFFFLLLLFLTAPFLPSAEISIPRFELMSWGRMEDEQFGIFSRAYLEIAIQGGTETFGGQAEFLFEDSSIEDTGELPSTYDPVLLEDSFQKKIGLKSLSVEMKHLLNSSLSLAYFTGTTDVFGGGKIFPTEFHTPPIASLVEGYVYFPWGVRYEGIYTVSGTGLKLDTAKTFDSALVSLYTYQDQYLGKGKYSSDLHAVFNFNALKMETFLGASYPISTYGLYRGGLLFYYSTPEGGEFFTQMGIPLWDPEADKEFTVDLFYFLFEPRVRIGLFAIDITFFWHPEYYLQQPTLESGTADIFLRFMYGQLNKTHWMGGIESGFTIQTNVGDEVSYRLTPLFMLDTAGVTWELRVNFNLYPYHLNSLVEAYLGAKTSF